MAWSGWTTSWIGESMTLVPTSALGRGHDGQRISVESSGTEPCALFVHANGFCKELWRPVTSRSTLVSRGGWVSMDQRGHGDSARGSMPYVWDTVARDVVSVAGAFEDVTVGIGHSSGGSAVARAEALSPGLFSRLVLIEPIVFPPPYERKEIPLASIAERRRRSFPTKDGALQRFANGPFATWEPETLNLYVDHGFRDGPDGWTLKCDPDVEADYYREGTNVDTWDLLPGIECPVALVVGAKSDTHRGLALELLASQFRDVEVFTVPDATHFVPMEYPGEVARLVDVAGTGSPDLKG
ncbi:MAG: alpha/beta fold hydrolase [Acidimicrobiia bacterium]